MRESYDVEFARQYNKICGKILQQERKERKISQKDLADGIMSKSALGDIETGKARWTKLTGDTLLLRMGIDPNCFETVAASEELDRWRLREDVCMLIPAQPAAAAEKLGEYRKKYQDREPLEEQFLIKIEAILALLDKEEGDVRGERAMKLALDAAACTIPEDWKEGLNPLWLAPGELEALLLAAAALTACGRNDEAWELQQSVWAYPKAHQWKERVMMLILPQAALLGMDLAQQRGDGRAAFDFGRESLELLRRNCCHCYVLPLLERMAGISVKDNSWCREEERNYLKEASGFCAAFQQIYKQSGYPGYRLWQGVFVDNTRDVGTVLKMLRHFEGKTRKKAVYDGEKMVISERQLVKIEKGEHKPSEANYRRLMKQYGKYEGWETAMLETDSVKVLDLRQQISTLIGFGQWEEAERQIERLRKKVDPKYPKVRQELLFWDALYKWRGNRDLKGSLEASLEALYCTASNFEGKDMKWWVFQREEIMIASHIASVYRRMKMLDESKKWFEAVAFSLKEQMARTKIPHYGYDVLMDGYDNLLGDMDCYEEAVELNEEAILNYLKWPQIRCMASVYYRIAWNADKIADEGVQEYEAYHQKCVNAFQVCESLSRFIYDTELSSFLKNRREKYLI